MYDITFLRHGESAGNFEHIIQGQSDFPLTEAGIQQARDLSARWTAAGLVFDRVFSSPLGRARQTAEIVAQPMEVLIEFDPIWMERNFGSLEGMRFEDIRNNGLATGFLDPYFPIGKTGESPIDLFVRANQALQKLVNQPAGRFLVVTHGAMMSSLLLSILGLSQFTITTGPRFVFSNTANFHVDYDPEKHLWRLLEFDNPYIEHWRPVQKPEPLATKDVDNAATAG